LILIIFVCGLQNYKKIQDSRKKTIDTTHQKQPGQHPLTASLQMGDQQPSTAHHTEFSNFPFSRFSNLKILIQTQSFPKIFLFHSL